MPLPHQVEFDAFLLPSTRFRVVRGQLHCERGSVCEREKARLIACNSLTFVQNVLYVYNSFSGGLLGFIFKCRQGRSTHACGSGCGEPITSSAFVIAAARCAAAATMRSAARSSGLAGSALVSMRSMDMLTAASSRSRALLAAPDTAA